MIQIAFIFGAVFFICMGVTFIMWIRFFQLVKKHDLELHEKIRFKWRPIFATNYGRFIFQKEYINIQDNDIVRYSKALYWLGFIGQWAFNVYMLLVIIMIIFF